MLTDDRGSMRVRAPKQFGAQGAVCPQQWVVGTGPVGHRAVVLSATTPVIEVLSTPNDQAFAAEQQREAPW